MPDTITHDSKLSLKLTIAMCGGAVAVAGAWYHMTGLVRDVRHELQTMNMKLEGVMTQQASHVEKADLRAWVREFKALNPNLAVPMPD